mmetsp:Transcript_3143/g.10389  ORF Transcript_3143/g.10389 Transcript_3143/m.10389 type:complete len:235 (+) Transcript_3143:457-1161(+)
MATRRIMARWWYLRQTGRQRTTSLSRLPRGRNLRVVRDEGQLSPGRRGGLERKKRRELTGWCSGRRGSCPAPRRWRIGRRRRRGGETGPSTGLRRPRPARGPRRPPRPPRRSPRRRPFVERRTPTAVARSPPRPPPPPPPPARSGPGNAACAGRRSRRQEDRPTCRPSSPRRPREPGASAPASRRTPPPHATFRQRRCQRSSEGFFVVGEGLRIATENKPSAPGSCALNRLLAK